MTEDLQAGTVLNDRYEIVKRIGGGGMGSVYHARDRRLSERACAVKEMLQSSSDEATRIGRTPNPGTATPEYDTIPGASGSPSDPAKAWGLLVTVA